MRLSTLYGLSGMLLVTGLLSCHNKQQKGAERHILKGLYSLGPEERSFKDCATGHEYWVADRSKQLELKYWQIIPFEKPDEPVYIEAEGTIVPSNKISDGGHGNDKGFDSTLVIKKLIHISKDIPAGKCK